MVNTVTNTRSVIGKKRVVQYVAVDSDGTEETDLVIYDSSAVATALGLTDPLNSRIRSIMVSGNAVAGICKLEWDASTDVLAYSFFGTQTQHQDFMKFGGLKNTAGTGITGDITLTTTGLASGDSLIIIIEVDPEYPSV